mgnify:FL=1
MKEIDAEEKKVLLRILDANVNRCAEGLRVVEEAARLGWGDRALQSRLKEIRHGVRRGFEALPSVSLPFRDSTGDVGRDTPSLSEMRRSSIGQILRANFARAEEALRVLEEYVKLLEPGIASRFKRFRFELYAVERACFMTEPMGAALPASPFIYAILDRSVVTGDAFEPTARALLEGGIDIVQYRAKERGMDERRRDLVTLLTLAGSAGIPVIVNDDPELAAEVGAQGVHLGSKDPSPAEARAVLSPGAIIGVTIHSIDELEATDLSVVDYIAVGSIFPSPTKRDVPPVGTKLIAEAARLAKGVKIVAIGGIDADTVESVFDAGADGAAMISGLLNGDVRKNSFTFKEIVARRRP